MRTLRHFVGSVMALSLSVFASQLECGGSTASRDQGAPRDMAGPGNPNLVDAAPSGPSGTLGLLAGGLGGSGRLDGSGAAAQFNSPRGLALDGAGNLFVADTSNHAIRKVVLATGAVTTLATIAEPWGVAVDGGNLYVADATNHAIYKVALGNGQVSTLAGSAGQSGSTDGTGNAARFYAPAGVAADGSGNLYIADSGNHTLRKVVLATGEVSTLAGFAGLASYADGPAASARFNYPQGLSVDSAGSLYVAETGNSTIRKVVLASGVVSTVAGSAGLRGSTDDIGTAARFFNPQAVAADGAGNLYVADTGNNTVRKVVLATGAVSTRAGTAGLRGSTDGTGAAARFYSPWGVAADGAGNLYVADNLNSILRKVELGSGAVTTLAGAPAMPGTVDGIGAAARFSSPLGLAVEAGNLYVADSYNHTIRQVALASSTVTTLAGTAGQPGSLDATGTSAQFDQPQGIAVDGAGNLYVADTNNHIIRKVVLATGVVTTVAGTSGSFGSTDGAGSAARFYYPRGVAVDKAGNLFIADTNNHIIRKVVLATGAVTTVAGTAGQTGAVDSAGALARFNNPIGVAADGAGNLYVADTNNHTIRRVVLATSSVSTLALHFFGCLPAQKVAELQIKLQTVRWHRTSPAPPSWSRILETGWPRYRSPRR